MPAALLLGLDIGTTGAKALLVRAGDGEVIAEWTSEYPLSATRPLWSEQNPLDWYRGGVESIQRVLMLSGAQPRQIAAIGLTGQMHGLTLLDGHGDVLRPAILWNDQRTEAECQELTRRAGGLERVLELIGNPILPGFTAPKLVWIAMHERELLDRIAHVLLPKDYVRFRLSGGALFTDVADASGTAMFDVRSRRWSDAMIDASGARREWLPPATESPVASAKLSAEAARATGLLEGTPIVSGAGDQAAAAVGIGILDERAVSVSIGTSGVVFAASQSFRMERQGRLHAFCHAAPGTWTLMGVMLSAGGSLRWYRDALGEPEASEAHRAGRDPYDALLDCAARIAPGSDGLIFLPYLTGERTPHADPYARGAFVGLSLQHTKAHLTRAVLEGVSFGLRDSLELMNEIGVKSGSLRLTGGGARSALWRQILADVFNQPIETVNSAHGAAYGAALLAGVGVGAYPSVEAACHATIRVTGVTTPGESVAIYDDVYAQYRDLYPALKPRFRRLTE